MPNFLGRVPQYALAMPLTIGANISSLRAMRALSSNSANLSTSFERLASGQRINRASDDAAGLAVSASLDVKSRLFAQGSRNLNDGISLLNIADGALQQLRDVTIRQKELAAQSANGSYSNEQRKAINTEASALTQEYNRIINTTSYNNVSLLNSPTREIALQGLDSVDGIISIKLGSFASSLVGDGTFQARSYIGAGAYPTGVVAADINGDGKLDLALADSHPSSNSVSVLLGCGDGTFASRVSFLGFSNPNNISSGDINGDGIVDLAVSNSGSTSVGILFGNGNGTFKAPFSVAAGSNPNDVKLVDFNGDGKLDIIAGGGDSTVSVILGNGDGTFKARKSYATSGSVSGLTVADFDKDGKLDVLTADISSNSISVFRGGSNGTLSSLGSLGAGWNPQNLTTLDANRDGKLDIAFVHSGSTVAILEGDGAGNFSWNSHEGVTGSTPKGVFAADFDGDGITDLATADTGGGVMSVFIGNGDSTYKARTSYASGSWATGITASDLNNDGALDIITADLNGFGGSVFLGNTKPQMTVSAIDLSTAGGARDAMKVLDKRLERIGGEIGQVGVTMRRLSVAINTLGTMRENIIAASARIKDADIAAESASLVSNGIIQKTAASVLAQTNQQPSIVLSLLRG